MIDYLFTHDGRWGVAIEGCDRGLRMGGRDGGLRCVGVCVSDGMCFINT